MSSVTVLWGQELTLPIAIKHFDCGGQEILVFPEGSYGPNALRKMLTQIVDQNIDAVFLTRYGIILNELGCMISESKLDNRDVQIHLYNEGDWSFHSFTEEGIMNDTWPFGVLE